MQVSALPGGFPGLYGIGLSFVLTEGLTSRGRIGINSSLTALPIVNPWFEDPVDKTVLIQGIKDVIANITINSMCFLLLGYVLLTISSSSSARASVPT